MMPHDSNRRIVIDGSRARRPRSSPREVPRSVQLLSGMYAALQAAAIGYLFCVVTAVASVVASTADPAAGDVSWWNGAEAGCAAWLAGFGSSVTIADSSVTVIPLGLTLLSFALVRSATRRVAQPTLWGALAVVVSFMAVVLVLGLVTGGPARSGVLIAMLGSGLVAAAGAWSGIASVRSRADSAGLIPFASSRITNRLESWRRSEGGFVSLVREGARAALVAVAALVAFAAVITAIWVVVGRDAVLEITRGLGADPVGAVALALIQIVTIPNLVLWAASWVIGPGFAVGTGTVFSPLEVASSPLPAVPLLGALPGQPLGALAWLVLIVPIAAGVVGMVSMWRRADHPTWPRVGLMLTAYVVAAIVMTAIVLHLSGGAIGPERFVVVGPQAWYVAAVFGLEALCGGVFAVCALHPRIGGAFARYLGFGASER